MAVSRAMRRLLHVLEIQEEKCRAAMESARAELKRLEQALTRSVERERGGRRLVAASAATGEITDRIAGIEETHVAQRIAAALTPRIAESESAVNLRQREFLGKRIERRQTETLIEEAEALERVEAGRRAQRDLDDWFLSRRANSGEAQADEIMENAHRPAGCASQQTRKS
ncbi:MAG: hypothetical protein P4K93_02860 [Terracidiphilus sp.]|nr:hypothetical protein [Terracidiphilus sp.]MDR3797065.1 hypothetical protein [Terracidiphilus sp.]